MGTESGLRRRVKGLSEAEFRQRYGTEAQCRAALFQLRWGKGWACPGCGHGGYAELKGRAVYQCNRCKRQVGLTAGTVFHWTKLPLTTWFLAIYHLSQSKGGMSSVELARRLGTRQPTAWLIKHKLMAAMEAREAEKPRLEGRVEVDDAYLGGRARAASAAGARPARRRSWPRSRRRPSASPGGSAHRRQGLQEEGDRDAGQARPRRRQQRRDRRPVLLDGGHGRPAAPLPDGHRQRAEAAKWAPFTWVNTALGNIKTALAGTYHHVSAKHAQRYLTSFAWRFNRRYQLDTLTERLAYACARTAPHPYRVIIAG